jgi:hypothetical protein
LKSRSLFSTWQGVTPQNTYCVSTPV